MTSIHLKQALCLNVSKSSLTILKVPGHCYNDVILLTDEQQPLIQGPFVSIWPDLKTFGYETRFKKVIPYPEHK